MVRQRNQWIHDQSTFIGSFDAPWSEWSWIADPADPDHPKGMHPESGPKAVAINDTIGL